MGRWIKWQAVSWIVGIALIATAAILWGTGAAVLVGAATLWGRIRSDVEREIEPADRDSWPAWKRILI